MPDTLVPVFDLGNVFIRWDPMWLFRKLFDTEEEARWFHTHICTLEWNLEFDAGVNYSEGVAKLITRFPKYWREIQAYDERWIETVGDTITETVAIHDELMAAGLKTYAITNFSWEKWMLCLPRFPFLSKFDGVIVSGLEGMVKPDPRIYRVFCERFALAPEQCVFIDDSEQNIVAARKFGMKGIHFADAGQARRELVELGLPLNSGG